MALAATSIALTMTGHLMQICSQPAKRAENGGLPSAQFSVAPIANMASHSPGGFDAVRRGLLRLCSTKIRLITYRPLQLRGTHSRYSINSNVPQSNHRCPGIFASGRECYPDD